MVDLLRFLPKQSKKDLKFVKDVPHLNHMNADVKSVVAGWN